MTAQISLRMPRKLLSQAKKEASARGYVSVQEFIRESVREQMYDPILTPAGIAKIEKGLQEIREGKAVPLSLRELRSGRVRNSSGK